MKLLQQRCVLVAQFNMAKVISIEPPKDLLKKHAECGAIIQYELRDIIKEFYASDYGGGGDTYREAICPNCNQKHQWVK